MTDAHPTPGLLPADHSTATAQNSCYEDSSSWKSSECRVQCNEVTPRGPCIPHSARWLGALTRLGIGALENQVTSLGCYTILAQSLLSKLLPLKIAVTRVLNTRDNQAK